MSAVEAMLCVFLATATVCLYWITRMGCAYVGLHIMMYEDAKKDRAEAKEYAMQQMKAVREQAEAMMRLTPPDVSKKMSEDMIRRTIPIQ